MLTLRGIYGREMYETWYAMSVLLQGGLDISPVITHRFGYEQYAEAFATARSGRCGKVVIDWTRPTCADTTATATAAAVPTATAKAAATAEDR
jgi:threonine 3-dehydrogenase